MLWCFRTFLVNGWKYTQLETKRLRRSLNVCWIQCGSMVCLQSSSMSVQQNFSPTYCRKHLSCSAAYQLPTSGGYPQTDGLVEYFNRTLKQMLAKMVGMKGQELLGPVLLPYCTTPHSSTGEAPFYLVYGGVGEMHAYQLLWILSYLQGNTQQWPQNMQKKFHGN